MTVNESINSRVAEELELRVSKVSEATKSMFDFLVSAIENREIDKPIRMQYLGLWECKRYRVEKLKEHGKIV